MLLAVFLFLPIVRGTFNGSAFEPAPIYLQDKDNPLPIVKIDETTVYVPMGRHIILKCASWSSAKDNYGKQSRNKIWIFRDVLEHRNIPINIFNSRFSYRDSDARLILYSAQKENEGIYDCHVQISNRIEWVSRVNVYVQDCDDEHELTSYLNLMNPCQYGGCIIAKFPNAPLLKYLKCNCILQYTGEFCTELVRGAVGREIIRFSPFIAHICSTVCIFIVFFCCKRTEKRKRIVSLEDVVPPPLDTTDNPRDLYPAALFPKIGEDQNADTEMSIEAIVAYLQNMNKG